MHSNLKILRRTPHFEDSYNSAEKNPYYVLRTMPKHGANGVDYEYSSYSEKLGPKFLTAACTTVKDLRHNAGVFEKTWLDNYATRFDHFVRNLAEFIVEKNHGPADTFNESDWNSFVEALGEIILADQISRRTGEPLSSKTKSKYRVTTNNLLAQFALSGVLPKLYQIPRAEASKRASDGKSVVNKQRMIAKAQENPPMSMLAFVVKNHNRKKPYDYGEFKDLAEFFLISSLTTLRLYYAAGCEGNAKKKHQVFRSFLLFLQNEKEKASGYDSEFFAVLASDKYSEIDAFTWERIVYRWKYSLEMRVLPGEKNMSVRAQNDFIGFLNRLWATLSGANIVPDVQLRGIKNASARDGRRGTLSLAQLVLPTSLHAELNLTEKQAVIDRLVRYFDKDDRPEGVEFIDALCSILPAQEVRRLTLDGLVKEINELNSNRLTELRLCAENDFLVWYEHWLSGQEAIIRATHLPLEMVDLLDNPLRSVSERRRNSTKLISRESEEQLGNTLNLLIGALGGISTGVNGRYHHIRRRWGGCDKINAYLHPHKRATTALWILLLIDTGANCEVAREMPFDCLKTDKDPNYKVISFDLKARAGYKRITNCLEIAPLQGQRLSSIMAIEYYKKMSARYRLLADNAISKFLFLDNRQSDIISVTEFSARDDFKEFLSEHSELCNLPILPKYIRPSYLLKKQHDAKGAPMEVAQVHADHSSVTTTMSYTHRPNTKIVHAQKIRKFTRLCQAVIIASIDGAAEKLGISAEDAARLFSEASRTGLGVSCLNPMTGIQPSTRPGEPCDRLDACPGCKLHYLIATENNIADLILLEEYLRSKEESAVEQNADVWVERWLPWLVLAEVAIAKFSQGETASTFERAKAQADQRRPTYNPFFLF